MPELQIRGVASLTPLPQGFMPEKFCGFIVRKRGAISLSSLDERLGRGGRFSSTAINAGASRLSELNRKGFRARLRLISKDQTPGFGVNRDSGEAGEKAVSEKACFASENRLFVHTSGDVLEFL